MTLSSIYTTTARRRWSALALLVTAQFMVILDVAVVNVALPSIKVDLGFSSESLQWVVSAYAILFGGTLLLGGRVGDLLGRGACSWPGSHSSPRPLSPAASRGRRPR